MFSVSGIASGIGNTTLPCVSLYSPSGGGLVVRELAVWNTTTTSCIYKWARLTSAGTPGSAITVLKWRDDGVPALGTPKDAHSSTGPTISTTVEYMPVGAAIGAGYYYTYYAGEGLVIPSGTGNGIGLVLVTGTGQLLGYKIVWEEA